MLRTALLLVLTLLTMVGPVRADEPVKMMTNTWPPYVDPTLPEQGLAAELVTHIFTRAGYSVENTIESWPQALEGVGCIGCRK
jgi:polar amino acid transport system substrate-binding protein